jgi:hypothetical protein
MEGREACYKQGVEAMHIGSTVIVVAPAYSDVIV